MPFLGSRDKMRKDLSRASTLRSLSHKNIPRNTPTESNPGLSQCD
jgi:hypothetical protein